MSIADRITSMSNNLSNAYDGIEYLGIDTTGVDKNLQNLSSMLNVVYEGLPKVSDEGISPTLEGSRVGRLNSTLKASDTTQLSTTGKNLVKPQNVNSTYAGMTCTFDSETQVYTFNGTCTADNTTFKFAGGTVNSINFTSQITKSVAYYINGSISGYFSARFFDATYSRDNNLILGDLSVNNPVIYRTASNTFTATNMSFRFNAGSVANNLKIRIMATDSDDLTYEPYTGGIPSPNPDYPQDIHVVKGNNTVEVCGKNLWGGFEPFTATPTGATFTTNTDGSITANISNITKSVYSCNGANVAANGLYQELEPGTYIASVEGAKPDYVEYQLYELPPDDTTLSIKGSFTAENIRTFTLTKKAKMGVRIRVNVGAELNNYTFKVMIRLASITDDTYEPYTGTTYPINLPEGLELCKIGDYQDILFKAVSGDTVYDTLTSEQKEGLVSGGWYKYGEAKKANTSDITRALSVTSTIGNDLYAYACNISTNINSDATLGIIKSNIFAPKILGSTTDTTNPDNVRFNMGISKHSSTQQIVISIEKRYLSTGTPQDFLSFLTNNNFYCLYVLATPTITQITDTTLISQLEALYKAMSKNGQTNVLQTNADVPFTIYASALKGE